MKRKISELLENVPAENWLPQEREERISLARVKRLTRKKLETEEKREMRFTRFPLRLLIAAALTAALSIGAFAAAHFLWDNRLQDQLKPDDTVKQQLTGAGMEVQKSETKDGMTLTVRQTVGDRNRLYILLDVEAPEGVVIGEEYSFEGFDILLSGIDGWGMGVKPLDEDFTDNRASYLLDVSTTAEKSSFSGETAKLTLKNLRYWQQGEGDEMESVSVLPGEWSVEWKLDYEDVTQAYPLSVEIPYCDGKAQVTMITVSPLSVSVTAEGEGIVGTGGGAWSGKSLDEDIVVKVKLKDGNVLYDKAATHISLDPEAGRCRMNRAFENAVNVDDIAAVIVNGVEIPLE